MSQTTLEERVTALEKLMAKFMANPKSQGPTDWRSTIGMFGDDPIQKKIDAAGRKIRSADRRRTKK
jgi:hypothetical protein